MRNLPISLIACLLIIGCTSAKADLPLGESFDRAQQMVYNLNRVAGSSGFFLLRDIRLVKDMDHDLIKALRQVQEVDKTYAKLRGRPDEKYMEAVTIKIEKAAATRALYEEDLIDAYAQLKLSIQDTLVTDVGRKGPKGK